MNDERVEKSVTRSETERKTPEVPADLTARRLEALADYGSRTGIYISGDS